DFITSGGEIPALVVIDSVIRLIPEFLEKEETIKKETFEDKLLEYPQYTRPETFEGYRIPEILKSGHHEKINLWRKREMLKRTLLLRPDLLMDRKLTDEEKELIKDIFDELLENMNKILKRE
ncbi:MAG TPA: tRNA (guanosine(37)-N1)-methyltransferase TrmD, partial [Firmicutes bacterium]|nr:tRNA (guanosine(37)-N1)-methyltransferase TrmD [Bacillota bacterium]